MAVGQGSAAFMHNLPAPGEFVIDPALFARETERSDVPQEQKTISLGGAPIDVRVQSVGILASIRIVIEGTLTVATAAVTTDDDWPWNLIRRFTLSANGQTGLIACEGLDLRARRQRLFRNPREHVSNVQSNAGVDSATLDPVAGSSIAVGSYTFRLIYDVPIVHDAYTLTGALLAQTDQNYLSWRIQPATASELFRTNPANATITNATVKVTNTFYDIPFADTQQGRKVIIPDLRWLHGFVSVDMPFANNGDVRVPLVRTSGQLLALHGYIENGTAGHIDPATLDELRWEYGGNRRPRVFAPVAVLLEENGRNYNGLLKPNLFAFDFEVDNPQRDIVYPKGVTELAVVAKIASSVTVNANARVHIAGEMLYSGR
jgi:hypothetical protein